MSSEIHRERRIHLWRNLRTSYGKMTLAIGLERWPLPLTKSHLSRHVKIQEYLDPTMCPTPPEVRSVPHEI